MNYFHQIRSVISFIFLLEIQCTNLIHALKKWCVNIINVVDRSARMTSAEDVKKGSQVNNQPKYKYK